MPRNSHRAWPKPSQWAEPKSHFIQLYIWKMQTPLCHVWSSWRGNNRQPPQYEASHLEWTRLHSNQPHWPPESESCLWCVILSNQRLHLSRIHELQRYLKEPLACNSCCSCPWGYLQDRPRQTIGNFLGRNNHWPSSIEISSTFLLSALSTVLCC